jgi:cytoskeletal protein RodZ
MPKVAEQLRTAREAQQLSIEDVANLTKLRTDHVRALESGNYSVFSAPVYVRGFTRTYAKLLKLDSKKVLEELTAELDQSSSSSSKESPMPHSKGFIDFAALYLSRINWKIVLPILILFGLIAMGSLGVRLWQYQQSKDPLADLGDGLYSSDKSLPSAYLPLRESPTGP